MLCSTLLGGKDESQSIYNPNLRGIRFLIILNNNDFQERSCWFYTTKSENIMQYSYLFPGKLEVISFDNYLNSTHKYNFIVNERAHKNKLYILLPKEKKYVLLEDFTKKWILSQLNELNVLFLRLNAESVKIKSINDNPILSTSLLGIHPGLDEYFIPMCTINDESLEIRYSISTENYVFNEKKFFYYDKWKTIINNRINEKQNFYEYYFHYKKPEFLNEHLFNCLKSLSIETVNNKEIDEFELNFEIFYYINEMID